MRIQKLSIILTSRTKPPAVIGHFTIPEQEQDVFEERKEQNRCELLGLDPDNVIEGNIGSLDAPTPTVRRGKTQNLKRQSILPSNTKNLEIILDISSESSSDEENQEVIQKSISINAQEAKNSAKEIEKQIAHSNLLRKILEKELQKRAEKKTEIPIQAEKRPQIITENEKEVKVFTKKNIAECKPVSNESEGAAPTLQKIEDFCSTTKKQLAEYKESGLPINFNLDFKAGVIHMNNPNSEKEIQFEAQTLDKEIETLDKKKMDDISFQIVDILKGFGNILKLLSDPQEEVQSVPEEQFKTTPTNTQGASVNIKDGNFAALDNMDMGSVMFDSSDEDSEESKEEKKINLADIPIVEGTNNIYPDIEDFIREDEINSHETLGFAEIEEFLKRTKEKTSGEKEEITRLDSNELLKYFNSLGKQVETQKEKLRLAKRALNVKSLQIEKLRSEGSFVPLDMAGSRLHLAFMFASPLIRKVGGKTENVMQLDCQTEIDGIIKVCSEMRYEMKYKSIVATPSNMRNILTDRPVALHFSGHGIDSSQQNRRFSIKGGNKGNILLLEDENSIAHHLYEDDLRELIQNSHAELEVVVVASCKSQFAGEVFLNAGAKHVICIMQGQKIGDQSCLLFSKVFYQTLFVKNYNVCTSFTIAKDEVKKVIKEGEANKFILLTQSENSKNDMFSCYKTEHRCQAVTNIKPGGLINMNNRPKILSIPSKPESFAGRQQEMYDIMSLLSANRLVTITGIIGLGKTTLLKNLAHYIKQRDKFSDGMIYEDLRGCQSTQMFFSRLSVKIRTE